MRFPNIEAERGRRGLTREEFVKPIGITTKTYGNWQNSKTDIPCSKLILMARMFNCSVDYLLGIDRHDNESA